MGVVGSNPVCYADVRETIRDGWVLLHRSPGLLTRAIGVAGRSSYTHAEMAGWWHKRLMSLGMASCGGRAVPLSQLVRRRSGKIDVYSVVGLRPVDSIRAVDAMIDVIQADYGWWNLAKIALSHLPVVRWFVRPKLDDTLNGGVPTCGHAVSLALRAAHLDAVPNLADCRTEPADLSRSAILKYEFTLT